MARPRNPKDENKGNILRVRLTDEQRKQLDDAAEQAGADTSTWVRLVALAAAKRLRA